MPDRIKSSARSYLRPLIVTFAALALASLFSFAAIELTEPSALAKQDVPKEASDHGEPADAETRAKNLLQEAKTAAASGEPENLIGLANLYLLGIGTEKNEAEAARLHKLGAEKGDASCQYYHGCNLTLGIGTKKDAVAGISWIRKSAAQQNEQAEYFLHQAYRDGNVVEKDEALARQWLLKAAEHGHHDARVEMAEEILNAQDKGRFKSVVTWVRKGALSGHARSCHVMSFVYQAGIGVKPDLVESMAWRLVMLNADDDFDVQKYRPAYDALSAADQAAAEKRAKELCGDREYHSAFARDQAKLAAERQAFAKIRQKAESGDPEAQYELSQRLEDGEGTEVNLEEAVRWSRMAAEQGHAKSQYRLGVYLANGEGVTADPKEAYQWFVKAAAQGDAYAEYAIAKCLRDGDGVKADLVESRKWLQRAADHGQPMAQWHVGCDFYDEKPDLSRDAIAARWFQKAAEQLHPQALISLGICYRLGRGVPKNPIEGLAWMAIGGDQYDSDQKSYINGLLGKCTEEDLKKVNERAKMLKQECREKFTAKLKAAEEKTAAK